ncbi:MAG: hypothetical protein EAZ92_12930 [Candidatus Kapaibacterium sp.]|nr:MAG: hypothetical protein EAZ92_12930 [Candidatus Kapabacteria bacterium]
MTNRLTTRTISRFLVGASLSVCCFAAAQNAFAQEAFSQEARKITVQQLPQHAAYTPTSSKTPSEAGLTASTQKKRVSLETEIQYLKEHPEAAFTLPADTQERMKQGLPVQHTKVSVADLEQQAKAQKASK